jgi:putative two-component system response regulator
MRILIVDDDDFSLSVLAGTLTRRGYSVVSAHDGAEAMDILRLGEIRLVITDWDMAGMNGVDLCRAIRREDLCGYIYLIMLTGREGAKQRVEGLCAGADDFLNKPLDPEELLMCLKTAERILSLETRDLALFALAKLAESRDADTGAHVERVQSYARLLTQHLSTEAKACNGVDDDYVRLIHQTSPLHDLGKVAIPDSVLLKPGRLNPDEFAIMRTHAMVGAQTLEAALQRFPNARFLQMARDIAATHHEKFDGSGYPRGLVGAQIPLCGRIVAVADVYDALTSTRIYKEAMPHEQAKAIVLRDRGSHFDPEVVDAFLRAEKQIVGVWERLRDPEQPASRRPAIALPTPSASGNAVPCKILVVEDDELLRQQVVNLLRATGEPVVTAANGLEAIKVWQEVNARVVVSDWEMPETDGVELCRYLRARCETAPPYFIMLTSHSDKRRLLDAYQAGVDDFVSKPFDQEELLARVRAGIRSAKLHDELTLKAAGSQAVNAQLATMNSRLERLSITDELTGLFNRRHAMYRLEEQWALAARYGRPLCVAMFDIDHFKKVNDTYGHDVGDQVLREVVGVLREHTRGTDAICRIGGEEFLVIFPLHTLEEACICVERCRLGIEQHIFKCDDREIRATVSAGVVTRVPELLEFTDLLKAADQALYAAKHAGRNTLRTTEDLRVKSGNTQIGAALGNSQGQPPAPIDLAAVLMRCGGDRQFAIAVTQRFRTQAAGEVEKIANALGQKDAATIGRVAHGLKSMAAYVAANSASELAKQIEDLGRAGNLSELEPLLAKLRQEVTEATVWLAQHAIEGIMAAPDPHPVAAAG